jgi:amino acid adenylation domain-containing protein
MEKINVYAYPVSSAQHRLWILSKFEKVSTAYNITGILKVSAEININVFKEAIRTIIQRHETLRTIFKEVDGEIRQLIYEEIEFKFDEVSVQGAAELDKTIKKKSKHVFDLEVGPLLNISIINELASGKYAIVISMHHIISDGWSIGIFTKECSEIYNSLLQNNEPALEYLETQYVDFTLWEKEQEETTSFIKQKEYWKSKLENSPALLELPYKKERPNLQSFNGELYQSIADQHLSETIKNFCLKNKVSPFMFLLAIYKIVLSKYANQSDILVGTPITNRNVPELEHLIGFFVNTLVIRTKVESNLQFVDYLDEVKSTSLEVFQNKDVSFETVLDIIKPPRNTSYSPVFQVMFSMENMPKEQLIFGDEKAVFEQGGEVSSKFDLTLYVREKGLSFEFEYEFNTDLFDRIMIVEFHKAYVNVLKSVLKKPTVTIADIVLLDAQAEKLILDKWNNTSHEYPKQSTFINQFKNSVEYYANKVAYEHSDTTLTYSELDKNSDRFAHFFTENGIGSGKKVALYIKRNSNLLPVLLGVLKTGATYIPLDPSYPVNRIKYIVEDSETEVILCNEVNKSLFDELTGIKVLAVENAKESTNAEPFNIPDIASKNQPVYMIYTSGSTGNPKGVRIAQHSLLNFLVAMKEHLGFNEQLRLLAVTSLAFDISGLELYVPLLSGGTVVLANEKEVKSAPKLIEVIHKHRINTMQGTPSLWQMLKEISWKPKEGFKIICGGEALPSNLAAWFLEVTNDAWNMYGPTETTIWSSFLKIEDSDEITIGRPIFNTAMYILDKNRRPVKPGQKGELYIGGDGLAIDYYKRPELVKDRFIEWNYKSRNIKLFKTGDLAKFKEDGTILYLGREDSQVKVNGYRIELGEIENKLLKLQEVDKAAVIVRKDNSDTNYLVAYLKLHEALTLEDVNKKLKTHLPAYMIPSRYLMLDELPLTPNGKIDRKALAGLQDENQIMNAEYVAPVTEIEITLTKIWQQVLEIDKIGVNDNFFDLGGASLQSVKISNLAEEEGLLATPELIFEFTTIKELALKTKKISGVNIGGQRIKQNEISVPRSLSSKEETGKVAKPGHTNISIESMGMYLPGKEVSSKELVQECNREIRFPIERLTGIKKMYFVEEEYTIGLAEKAIEKCLAVSKYKPEHIDLVITCNIFRMGSEKSISIEPGLSIQLSTKFGFKNALNFDITNACTGVFTAIYLAEAFIKSGAAHQCLIVSGEYISHVAKTSQLEVESYMDTRIAGLTLGDAGFAMILEKSNTSNIGFQKLDIFTMGAYSDLCIVKPTSQPHGGFVVRTDAIKMGEAGHVAAANHALKTLDSNNWDFSNIDHIIMHQASSTTTQNAMREINKVLNEKVTNSENIIDNIKERGNTATTTYWLATLDNILNGRISSNSNLIYCISGSGLTLGTALYAFDDLPDRIRTYEQTLIPQKKIDHLHEPVETETARRRLKVSAIGVASKGTKNENGLELLYEATDRCIHGASNDLDLIVYFGINREEYMYEPAISTFLAGRIKANASVHDIEKGRNTFAFDLMNGAMGFLNTCHVMHQMAQANKCSKALITTSEIDNNKRYDADYEELPIFEGAASILLEASDDDTGFGSFVFESFPEHINDKKSWAEWDGIAIKTIIQETDNHCSEYAELTIQVVKKLLAKEVADLDNFNVIFAPQFSDKYLHLLASSELFKNWKGKWITTTETIENSTLTTAYQLNKAFVDNEVKSGDTALIINIASGLQIGCATYKF